MFPGLIMSCHTYRAWLASWCREAWFSPGNFPISDRQPSVLTKAWSVFPRGKNTRSNGARQSHRIYRSEKIKMIKTGRSFQLRKREKSLDMKSIILPPFSIYTSNWLFLGWYFSHPLHFCHLCLRTKIMSLSQTSLRKRTVLPITTECKIKSSSNYYCTKSCFLFGLQPSLNPKRFTLHLFKRKRFWNLSMSFSAF